MSDADRDNTPGLPAKDADLVGDVSMMGGEALDAPSPANANANPGANANVNAGRSATPAAAARTSTPMRNNNNNVTATSGESSSRAASALPEQQPSSSSSAAASFAIPAPTVVPVAGAPVRKYINANVTGPLLEGMKKIAVEQPRDPLRVLGEFLLEKSRQIEGTQ